MPTKTTSFTELVNVAKAACEGKVSETREPVEIVYKKTTYKTVCDPKTVSQVTYETLPYDEQELENN